MAIRGPGALVAFALVLLVAHSTVDAWTLFKNYDGTNANFFDNFVFWADEKGTHNDAAGSDGYVYYTSHQQAQDWGLISTGSTGAFIRSDSTTISSGPGRAAVRMQTNITFSYGLFIADIAHMPEGCGIWPSIWMTNDPWPGQGEIDIIEGVNLQGDDKTTLHTGSGCNMAGVTNDYTGEYDYRQEWGSLTDCNKDAYGGANLGCGVWNKKNNFGGNLNGMGGGVWAWEWTSSGIRVWFWPSTSIPSDITSGSPNPGRWSTPYANFPFGPHCPSSKFGSLHIIINLTFCGAWGNGDWSPWSSCSTTYPTTCTAYVQNNPSHFANAYWQIRSIKVYQ